MSAPWALEDDTERLTVDDLRTIQQVLIERAEDHRRVCRRLERADVIAKQSRVSWILEHHEAIARYERIASRVGREILELEWEL